MHTIRLLHKRLREACPEIHLARLNALLKAVEALLQGGKLTLTTLGRHVQSRAFPKHKIKGIDRLLGNAHLHRERLAVCGFVVRLLIGQMPRPVIVIDWSDCPKRPFLMLKAALPVGGRALPLYQEVHALRAYKNAKVHRAFLRHLQALLPDGCRPIIVTDAGFQGPWFRDVERLGWDWVARIRGRVQYRRARTLEWQCITTLFPRAGPRPRALGHCWLSKRRPHPCWLYLTRLPRTRRRDRPKDRNHGHGTVARRCRQAALEPWLIATSLEPDAQAERTVMSLYGRRMQIEETFRDLKSHRYGYGLHYTHSRSPQRLEVLLLIGGLAMMLQWLSGVAIQHQGWTRHFQANTTTAKRVLSLFFLGGQLRLTQRFALTARDLTLALILLPETLAKQAAIP